MTRAAGTNHEAAPAASVVASEGLRLYKRLNCIDVVIPLLPCLPQYAGKKKTPSFFVSPKHAMVSHRRSEAETLIQRIIATGNKELVAESIKMLLTFSQKKEDPLQPLAFVKGEQVLDLLFRSAATTANFEPLPFRCVVDALDVCVALAQGPTPIFPSQVTKTMFKKFLSDYATRLIERCARFS